MRKPQPDTMLSASRARHFIGIRKTAGIIRFARKGIIPATPVFDGDAVRWRFKVSDLLAWKAEREKARVVNG